MLALLFYLVLAPNKTSFFVGKMPCSLEKPVRWSLRARCDLTFKVCSNWISLVFLPAPATRNSGFAPMVKKAATR